jgi:hypothetical protein
MTSQENPPKIPLNAKDISFEPLENTQETKSVIDESKVAEQLKKEKGEIDAEKEYSLQRVSGDKQSIEDLTQQAVEAAKLNEASNALRYEKQPEPEAVIEDDIDKEAIAILNTKVASKPSGGVFSKAKNWTMALLGLGMTGQALATEGGKKEEPKKPTQEQTIDTKKARKIDKEPTDPEYKKVGTEGDKTFYAKKSNSELEKAKPGSAKANPEEYLQQMIEKVKSGISPQDLLKQGYITPKVAKDLEQYVDVVYTQPEAQKTKEVKKDPFAAYAEEGEVIYANGKAAATMHYRSRKSTNIEVGGGVNTSDEDVLFKFLDANGNFNGKYIQVKKGEDLNNALAGSKYFQGNSFEKLNDNALSINNTYELTGDDIASGTTIK